MKSLTILLMMSFFALPIFLISCGPTASDNSARNVNGISNFTNCILKDDQGEGSLKGKFSSLPIKIAIDRDFFFTDQGAQAEEIKNAVNTWNEWSARKGLTAFEISNDGTGDQIPETEDCSQNSITNARTDVVGIWKIQNGGEGRNVRDCGRLLPEIVQGQTDWNVTTGGVIQSASVLLNFADFNTPGKLRLDLQSLVLHELGHVLGLLHSCDPNPDADVDETTSVGCAIAPSAYIDAVMFPGLGSNELRRELAQNDYDRVNCLY